MPTGVRNSSPRDLVPGFAKMIEAERIRRGWSQRELSRRAEVSAMCVCDIEGERRSPSLRVAARIAKALRLRVWLAAPAKKRKRKAAAPAA